MTNRMHDMTTWHMELMVKTLETVVGVAAKDLTDDQKFAVAVFAGVPTEPNVSDGHAVHLRTRPCTVTDDCEGGYLVRWVDDYDNVTYGRVQKRKEA